MFEEYLEFIPEDKRTGFKELASQAIIVKSREDAAKYLSENQFFKSEKDALISRTTDAYAEKFKAEKLPALVDEEYRKKNPPKDPKDQAMEEMKTQLADMKRQTILEKRKSEAISKLNELGLPSNLAKFAINEDENIFANNISELSGLKAWGEELKKSVLTGAVGNQKTPATGETINSTFTRESLRTAEGRAEYQKALNSGVKVAITE